MSELLNIDFSSANDEFNWVAQNSSSPVETVNGQLKLTADDSTTSYTRSIGNLITNGDRVRVKSNLIIKRPFSSSNDQTRIWFQVKQGSNVIDEFSIYDTFDTGQSIAFYFDRIYKYTNLTGSISLKVYFSLGYDIEVFLKDLIVENYQYDETNIRTYFAIDNLLADSLQASSAALDLKEWKVDGAETLTNEFFAENSPGSLPNDDFKFASADLDGSNRATDVNEPITFNPFIAEWGLNFDPSNYYGGKPTGTASGSNYGTGVMQIGFKNPIIYNGNLEKQNGAFFIDIDFSKSLRIVFDVVINNLAKPENVFVRADSFRRYHIIWNADTCTKEFYYTEPNSENPNNKVSVLKDGFLYGITPPTELAQLVQCDESFSYSGTKGTVQVEIEFGTAVGQCGIDYNALSRPDKFTLEWNGQIFSSGFVGLSWFDQSLINAGVDPNDINTADPANGSGQLLFNKDQAQPTKATLTVEAPLDGTAWNISGICPIVQNFTNIFWSDTGKQDDRSGSKSKILVSAGKDLISVTDKKWQIDRNDGNGFVDLSQPEGRAEVELSEGLNIIRYKAIDQSANTVYSNTLKYTRI